VKMMFALPHVILLGMIVPAVTTLMMRPRVRIEVRITILLDLVVRL
jgi:hypothetical protein